MNPFQIFASIIKVGVLSSVGGFIIYKFSRELNINNSLFYGLLSGVIILYFYGVLEYFHIKDMNKLIFGERRKELSGEKD